MRWLQKKVGNSRGGTIGSKGQIAIFVALIFQVLFVFFAMVVNVGLIVHHKINLQNSVDLAAYYGAMKQAEGLNAVAHINYQIRQAWKLLVWRYRHLGMAGDTINHPYDSLTKTMRGGGTVDQPFMGGNCPASFCINHPIFDIQEPWEYYCRDMCSRISITLLGVPAQSGIDYGLAEGILGGLARAIEAASRNLVDKTQQHCRNRSALNWYALARFIGAYKYDMKNRKQVLNKLANGLSQSSSDFIDVDGDSAREGALATFWRNLSLQNQEQIDDVTGETRGGKFSFYNSLGDGQCGGTPGSDQIPPKWLVEQFVRPLYAYLEGDCDGSTEIGFQAKVINSGVVSVSGPKYRDGLPGGIVEQLTPLIAEGDTTSNANRLWHTTVGYEKNPWCVAYVGVDAYTTPKIPFTPLGPVKISARAFAKPFGGRIGPWFTDSWSPGATSSKGANQLDKNLPPRVIAGETPAAPSQDNLRADFSRYTGDQVGTKSTMTMGQVSQSLWRRHQPPNQASWNFYNHLLQEGDPSQMGTSGDMLAWNAAGNGSVGLRDVEISFVTPDQFDVTYYSIEPDFWRNFAIRIQKRQDFQNLAVRGDLGFRRNGGEPWASFTIKDQIAFARGGGNILPWGILSYYIGRDRQPASGFVESLTGWHAQQPGDYSLERARFGNCQDEAIIPDDEPNRVDIAQPGGCYAGGRVGYSVKLVDGEYLQSTNLELGGAGQTGALMNRWDESSFSGR